tara:strand:- start:30843 stop:31160 length:318 start_codon:yes stop_codon:yes gene_type:complete
MSKEKKNKIEIDGTPIEIKAKRLTFFDVQAVAPLLMNNNMDFSQYWRHALANWLYYEPSIDIDNLSPEEGKELAKLLPEPSEVMNWLVFREAKSDKLSTLSMGGQ